MLSLGGMQTTWFTDRQRHGKWRLIHQRISLLFVLSCSIMLIVGCVKSSQPVLSDEQTTIVDDLCGVWTNSHEQTPNTLPEYIHVGKATSTLIEKHRERVPKSLRAGLMVAYWLRHNENDKLIVSEYIFFPVKIEGRHYLNIIDVDESVQQHQYFIVRCKVKAGNASLSIMSGKDIKVMKRNGVVAATSTPGAGWLLTGSSMTLQHLLVKHADDLFANSTSMRFEQIESK